MALIVEVLLCYLHLIYLNKMILYSLGLARLVW